MRREFRIVENVYRKHVRIYVDPNLSRAWCRLREMMADKELSPLKNVEGRTYFPVDGDLDFVIWLRRSDDLPTLAHEIAHVTFAILHSRGVLISQEADESFTYLFEYLFRCALMGLGHMKLAGALRSPRGIRR